MYLLGRVEEVAGVGHVSRWASPDSEGGLETETHPHSQGNIVHVSAVGLHIMKGDVHLLISFPGRFHHSGGLLPSR